MDTIVAGRMAAKRMVIELAMRVKPRPLDSIKKKMEDSADFYFFDIVNGDVRSICPASIPVYTGRPIEHASYRSTTPWRYDLILGVNLGIKIMERFFHMRDFLQARDAVAASNAKR